MDRHTVLDPLCSIGNFNCRQLGSLIVVDQETE